MYSEIYPLGKNLGGTFKQVQNSWTIVFYVKIHISVNPKRRKRSVENIEAPNGSFSRLANYLTNFECGKNLLCELEAKFTYELDPDETLILNLFK